MSRASKEQTQYIEQLLIDVGIGIDRQRRNAELTLWVGHEVKYLDELTVSEASLVIDKLKEIKYGAE